MYRMARFKRGQDIDQPFLLPPSVRDWLPEDHLAWFVFDAVQSLDIDELSDRYRVSGKGELPYEPRMMLRILIYAYATGVFSSRKIAKQLEDSVAFRVLAANQMPAHRTICRFRERHIDQFGDLFAQVVRLAAEAGLAKIGTLAVDGSKLKANASKRKAMSYGRLKDREAELKKEIAAILKMATDTDAEEDVEFGPDFRGDELPEELASREKRLAKIQAAKERLERRKAEEARAEDERKRKEAEDEGRKPPRERPGGRKHPKGQPKPKDQENFTDTDSRIMIASTGFEQCYNVQAAADGDSRLVVAAAVSSNASDAGQLVPMVEAAMENTDRPVNVVLADAGYGKEAELVKLQEAEIDAYVAIGREGQASKRTLERRPAAEAMQRKLNTKRGRARYRKRKHIVEPVFGWVKNVLGFRSFSLRGLTKVSGEWELVCLALNLRRMQALQG
jgi:transposase